MTLDEGRAFKTLSSIPHESKEYGIFHSYIELDKLLFFNHSTNENENLYNEILEIYNQNKEYKDNLFEYLINLLVYFIVIRPKNREFPGFLLSKLLLNFPEKCNIIDTIKEKKYFKKNLTIQDVLYSKRIIQEEPQDYNERKDTVFSIYKEGSLEFIIKEDDINKLKDLLNTEINEDIEININSPIKEVLNTSNISLYGIKVKLLDFCSFYGSIKCFKFLKMNGREYGKYIREMSISGGNFDIIHDIEQDSLSFDNCFEVSVKYHHQNISDWLLSNYQCEILNLAKALEYFDYQKFLFLLLNNIDVNKGKIKPLGYFCKEKEVNIQAIQLLLERGADVNKCCKEKIEKFTHLKSTPLGYLCKKENVNTEAIKILLDHDADVDKSIVEYTDDGGEKIYSPLAFLCLQKEVNLDAIKLLLNKGADINQDCIEISEESEESTFTILFYLCQQKNPNIQLIQLLIENGANINKLSNDLYGNYITPLGYLCSEEEMKIDLIHLLLERGADVNRGDRVPLGYLLERNEINLELIKLLIDKGVDLNDCYRDERGYLYTPLMDICRRWNINRSLIH